MDGLGTAGVQSPGETDLILPASSVRWYSYRAPHTLKGTQDNALLDVPHRGSLLRFCAADNATIEAAYQSRRDELERLWWEEEADLQQGPLASPTKKTAHPPASAPPPVDATTASGGTDADAQQTTAPDGSPSWTDFMVSSKGEEIGVPVRSGSYEINLATRIMRPCYWPAPRHRVLRGTWFAEKAGEWVPLREALADQLEQAYISQVWLPGKGLLKEQLDGRRASRVELSVSAAKGLYALFYSAGEAFMMRDSSFGWLRKLGAGSAAGPTSFRLRRGYVDPPTPAALQKEADVQAEAADDAAAVTPATSLLLVVHGIGQNLQGANIAQDALALRKALRVVERDAATSSAAAQATTVPLNTLPSTSISINGRVEVLPVQWRKTLSLEVDSLAAGLMPPGIPTLRNVLHSTAVEVLLYLTPLHRGAILTSLVGSMNSVYAKFMLRNPEFRGSVSVLAHSLGSILCWDILCNQSSPPTTMPPMPIPPAMPAMPSWNSSAVSIDQLHFDVDRLILVGSPLGCFLALRGVNQAQGRGLGTAAAAPLMQCHPGVAASPDGLPAARRVYNLYHPYDPVAYRLEPLAYGADMLARHRPALAELAAGGKRLHIQAQELGDSVSNAANRLSSTIAGALSFKGTSKTPQKGKEKGASGSAGEKPTSAPTSPVKIATLESAIDAPSLSLASLPLASTQGVDTSEQPQGPLSFPDEPPVENPQDEGNTPLEGGTATPEAHAPTSIARVVSGSLDPAGGWPCNDCGRLDFSLQEASLESQYLSALSAHFLYWSSPDVALFVHRAVRGVDVLSGTNVSAARAPALVKPAAVPAVAEASKEGPVVEAMKAAEAIVFGQEDSNWSSSSAPSGA